MILCSNTYMPVYLEPACIYHDTFSSQDVDCINV